MTVLTQHPLDTRESRTRDREITLLSLYETALYNIAHGYWNAGRKANITAREYAAEILRRSR